MRPELRKAVSRMPEGTLTSRLAPTHGRQGELSRPADSHNSERSWPRQTLLQGPPASPGVDAFKMATDLCDPASQPPPGSIEAQPQAWEKHRCWAREGLCLGSNPDPAFPKLP